MRSFTSSEALDGYVFRAGGNEMTDGEDPDEVTLKIATGSLAHIKGQSNLHPYKKYKLGKNLFGLLQVLSEYVLR